MQTTTSLSHLSLCVATLAAFAPEAWAAPLDVQTVTNKGASSPGAVVQVRAVATSGGRRLSASSLKSAQVTIKSPAGATVASAAMSRDTNTGLSYFDFSIPAAAETGVWTATAAITDTSNNVGSASAAFRVRPAVSRDHSFLTAYDGTSTCLGCHPSQGNDVFGSLHYQWKGDTSKSIELAGTKVGKLGAINNFCLWPDANWLTIFQRVDGKTAPGGCATCHAGLGLKPEETVSQAQLENIDCLVCHATNYSREVYQRTDGTFYLDAAQGVDKLIAARSVGRPTRDTCLRCHLRSGGGANYKRGDIEGVLASGTKAHDVHMGTDGQAFACQDCHRTEKHRMVGRGADMRALDAPGALACETCHTSIPHRSTNASYADLNRHTDRVDCAVCHVSSFAKATPTDMHRNWAVMELDVQKQLYDPEILKASNVEPQYTWFNGYSHFYRFKDPIAPDSRGIQKLAWPDGAFVDPAGRFSKLYPFKVHSGEQPIENTTRQLLPVRNKVAFETGDVTTAVQLGAAAAGMSYTSHSFFPTEQYMGIYHGVGPKSTALGCATGNCHAAADTRISFASLGFQQRGTAAQLCDVCHSAKTSPGFDSLHAKHRDRYNCVACHGSGSPLKAPRSTLCVSCHSAKSATIEKIHDKHVRSKKYDCSRCHTFSGGMTGGHAQRD